MRFKTVRLCDIEDCPNQTNINGLCLIHYTQEYNRELWLQRSKGTTKFFGRGLNHNGYAMGTYAGKYGLVHRIVMEIKIGRPLRADEVVHHLDGDKINNDIGNLELMTRDEHMRHHAEEAAQKLVGTTKRCTKCNIDKPRTAFPSHTKKSKYGFSKQTKSECKICYKHWRDNYFRKHSKRLIKRKHYNAWWKCLERKPTISRDLFGNYTCTSTIHYNCNTSLVRIAARRPVNRYL